MVQHPSRVSAAEKFGTAACAWPQVLWVCLSGTNQGHAFRVCRGGFGAAGMTLSPHFLYLLMGRRGRLGQTWRDGSVSAMENSRDVELEAVSWLA
ncbi:hypothetical protein IG631_10683 [Alternaria alternata]|nr:hypothetical protein IG631_10683 [Alternaria alternata]